MQPAHGAPKPDEPREPTTQVIVYICPTPGCGNHYASQNFRSDRSTIEAMQHRRGQNDGEQVQSHTRVACPSCRLLRGIDVQRVPYVVTQVVPLSALLSKQKAQRKALTETEDPT